MKLVILDLDYTLVDASEGILRCTKYALKKLGIPAPPNMIIERTIGLSFADTLASLRGAVASSEAKESLAVADFKEYFLQEARRSLTDGTALLPGAELFLKDLRSLNLQIALVTSKYRAEVEELLSRTGLNEYFDMIVCGDDVESPKPDPMPIKLALRSLGCEPYEAVYIGDSEVDLQASRRSHVRFIPVTTGTTSKTAFENYGQPNVCRDLTEVFDYLNRVRVFDIQLIQELVDEHVQRLGGYWRPLSAIARLLEECGEFVDAEPSKRADELADILIISVCIANQYCVRLRETFTFDALESDDESEFARYLLPAAGDLARVVNAYEGDKALKANEHELTVTKTVSDLISRLYHYSVHEGLDLSEAVNRQLSASGRRDEHRFERRYDPSTAGSRSSFRKLASNVYCPFATSARIWGGRDWIDNATIRENAVEQRPQLRRFLHISRREKLDAFVIALPVDLGRTPDTLGATLATVLQAVFEDSCSSTFSAQLEIAEKGGKFTIYDEPVFISTFSPCYAQNHSRHSFNLPYCYIVIQPEHSFDDSFKIGKREHEKIRGLYDRRGQNYFPSTAMTSGTDLHKFVKPLTKETKLDWWSEHLPDQRGMDL